MQHRQALTTKYEGTENQASAQILAVVTVFIRAVAERVYPRLEVEFFSLWKKVRYPSEGDIFSSRITNLIFGFS